MFLFLLNYPSFLVIIFFGLLLILIEFYNRSLITYKVAKKIPGYRTYPLIGNLLEVMFLTRNNSVEYTSRKAKAFKQGYKFYAFGILHYWPIKAKEIEFALNSSKHTEKSMFYPFLCPLLGDGLLCSKVLLCCELFVRNSLAYKAATNIPGAKIYPILGNIPSTFYLVLSSSPSADAFQYSVRMAKQFKKAYRFFVLGLLNYWPIKSSEIEIFLNSSMHTNKSVIYKFLHPMMGDGLLCSKDKKWINRRRILTPAFHFNILQQFLTIFKEESEKFVTSIKAEKNNNQEIELMDKISRFTLNNICETAMGVKLNTYTEPDNYREMIYRSGELLFKRYINPVLYHDVIFQMTSIKRELEKCVKVLHEFSKSVIQQRRNTFINKKQIDNPSSSEADITEIKIVENIYEKKRCAMLDTLLEAELNGGQIDEQGICEEVDTFMFEGYDTTSSGILFSLFMIATHLTEQDGIYQEIQEILNENQGREFSIHDYNKMKLLDRVIKESLRLYPPVPYISRQINETVDIGIAKLPPSTQIHIFIYNVHRDPEQFPEPEKFDADRFLPENIDKRHPFAYIPFSAGPRNCIGQKFAMLEIKTLLTSILRDYRLEAITKVEDVLLVGDLVLRTKDPIKIKFIKR